MASWQLTYHDTAAVLPDGSLAPAWYDGLDFDKFHPEFVKSADRAQAYLNHVMWKLFWQVDGIRIHGEADNYFGPVFTKVVHY